MVRAVILNASQLASYSQAKELLITYGTSTDSWVGMSHRDKDGLGMMFVM